MNKKLQFLSLITLVASAALFAAPVEEAKVKASDIGIVNFKECIEKSKLGKQEQARFDDMKKQMEKTMEVKEKELNEMAPKLNDEYIDTLTPEAEKDLKEKFKNLSQELSQQQNQYYHLLNQANFQIVQKMNDLVANAASKVAAEKGFKLILNEEACFFRTAALDLSKDVVAELDALFAKDGEQKVAVKESEKKVTTEKK